MRFDHWIKIIHAWLGVFVMPWVICVGLTGFYMNHPDLVLGLLPEGGYDAAAFDGDARARPVTKDAAFAAALRVLPSVSPSKKDAVDFMGRPAFVFDGGTTDVAVDAATGLYWVSGPYVLHAYAPDGLRLGSEVRWHMVLESLHMHGWLGDRFGSLLMDITAMALITFGLSGLYGFVSYRRNRHKYQHLRGEAGLTRKDQGKSGHGQ